ncbi:MAG: 2-C-methyl-D-erythritol 2,4-cyclodiphosphate synthase [Candidatus Aminicenantales bacterium]
MRVKAGLGYDIHRFSSGRKLYLGGIEISHSQGLLGHSDGDCLLHALIDALLGALGEGDIGQLFPDTDPGYKNIRSTELLKRVMARVRARRMEIINVDTVIIAEEPKLAPYVERMKEVLSSLLGIEKEQLEIKAKTNEGLGPVGRKEAVACWAVCLLREKSPGHSG